MAIKAAQICAHADLETTGLIIGHHEVIEIFACVAAPDTQLATTISFHRLLHPEHPERAEPGIMGIKNHYDAAKWAAEAVPQAQGWREFADWTFQAAGGMGGRLCLIGQNLVTFDQPMIEAWSKHFGVKPSISYTPRDLISSYRDLRDDIGMPAYTWKLAEIAEFFGIINPQAHCAKDDVHTTAACWALCRAYRRSMIENGFRAHATILDDAWTRIGFPRSNSSPVPQ